MKKVGGEVGEMLEDRHGDSRGYVVGTDRRGGGGARDWLSSTCCLAVCSSESRLLLLSRGLAFPHLGPRSGLQSLITSGL